MKSTVVRLVVGIVLAGSLPASALVAQEGPKALPTLLIKGEIVSVDATDPAASLLKVKDRYGFETPIFLTQETKITQGDSALAVANLTTGAAVEVEYNFDVNTAKRHAVSVKLAAPTPPAEAAAPAAALPESTQTVAPPAEPAPAEVEAPPAPTPEPESAPAAESAQ